MRITDLLKASGIALDAKVTSKSEAIDMLVDLMADTGNLSDKEAYKKDVLAREASSTTGIGESIAIPHAKSRAVKAAGLAAMVVKDGVEYESLDGQPAKLFFLIAAPDTSADLHVEVLSRLATILMDSNFKNSLLHATSAEEFLKQIDETEAKKFPEEAKKAPDIQPGQYQILAVTACPTGIAHTFMAAEKLEQTAKEMGISIKVETNGSGGAKNVLTAEEIKNADCIIIAADKNVELARFSGKPVIQTRVADGIHKAKELLERATKTKVPVYYSNTKEATQLTDEHESFGRQIYKHLMNGVSHMLPFVIGGGILIALAFLFDDYTIDPSKFGSNTPLAAFLMKIGGTAFGFMLPVLAGFIAMSIGDRPALAVGFVGGMLANSGGSGFLGALIAGFVAGYIVLGLRKLFSGLPQSLEGLKPVLLYPFFGVLLIGAIILLIINPPVGAINAWMSDGLNSLSSSSKIFLGILLGGMMAVDMGGPINKAAYVFGTASLANGQYEIMAAVMAGGMVPPLAIALCTTFFKNRFTESERKSGVTNYIMGLSFITEGAIPFASADPVRVLPACILGSATAGALSMMFNCALRAPHGGLFVVPVISNPFGYLAALIIGSIVGMLVLALLKKPLQK
ncbi:PTS fructose transporter subunit IIABC [Anaerosinus massiliensis]|uniref:PTS fructose transporter subunit IIABC n=1 Tax=Massilibacillus massiliensis TaxID=1806837 RepID=UPI000B0AB2BC|nr:fructose-specific PTS transporter subunit EIIC [Massilibacillus massiliensis]